MPLPLELKCAMLPLPAQPMVRACGRGWLIGVEELEVRDFWMCVNLLCVTLLPFGGRVLASRIAALKNHEEAKLILSRNPSFLLCLTLLNSKIF